MSLNRRSPVPGSYSSEQPMPRVIAPPQINRYVGLINPDVGITVLETAPPIRNEYVKPPRAVYKSGPVAEKIPGTSKRSRSRLCSPVASRRTRSRSPTPTTAVKRGRKPSLPEKSAAPKSAPQPKTRKRRQREASVITISDSDDATPTASPSTNLRRSKRIAMRKKVETTKSNTASSNEGSPPRARGTPKQIHKSPRSLDEIIASMTAEELEAEMQNETGRLIIEKNMRQRRGEESSPDPEDYPSPMPSP